MWKKALRYNEESGLPHIGHILCNAMMYSYNQIKPKDTQLNLEL